MRTNFVLIDSENVKPDYIERLVHEHFRVFVFVGANMNRLGFQIVNAVQSLGSNASYVKVSGHGPDALDFHIAYYIGKLSASYPDAYFHIISKDGFASKVGHHCGMRSVPPRGSGWVEPSAFKNFTELQCRSQTHPLPRGGTDLMPQ